MYSIGSVHKCSLSFLSPPLLLKRTDDSYKKIIFMKNCRQRGEAEVPMKHENNATSLMNTPIKSFRILLIPMYIIHHYKLNVYRNCLHIKNITGIAIHNIPFHNHALKHPY